MAKKAAKPEFGAGIRALLGNPKQLEKEVREHPEEVARELAGTVAGIPIEQIEANPYQPRKDFDKDALEELAASIRVHGLIQPVTLRRLHDKAYQLISGERRFRASQLAGLTEVPAYVRLADDQQMLEMALIENIQREDLNAMEIATSYQRLIDECNLTHENISDRVGKKRSTVTNFLRLLKLPVDIQIALKKKQLTMGHARALAAVDDFAFKMAVFKQILEEDLSVRATEAIIKDDKDIKEEQKARPEKPSGKLPEALRKVQDQFSAYFGAKVKLNRDRDGKGSILIKFSNDAELNRMLDLVEK